MGPPETYGRPDCGRWAFPLSAIPSEPPAFGVRTPLSAHLSRRPTSWQRSQVKSPIINFLVRPPQHMLAHAISPKIWYGCIPHRRERSRRYRISRLPGFGQPTLEHSARRPTSRKYAQFARVILNISNSSRVYPRRPTYVTSIRPGELGCDATMCDIRANCADRDVRRIHQLRPRHPRRRRCLSTWSECARTTGIIPNSARHPTQGRPINYTRYSESMAFCAISEENVGGEIRHIREFRRRP